MSPTRSFEFRSPPSVWATYARVAAARKPSLVPEGRSPPRIEARYPAARIDAGNLEAYRRICADTAPERLPIAYPHVLASPIHLAMLGSDAFPVKLMGLVHVANRIVQQRPLRADESLDVHAWIEGHRETERGQEFDLETEVRVEDVAVWRETCTFLARRRSGARAAEAGGAARTPSDPGPSSNGPAVVARSFAAPAGLGRRYGLISGDINPIHLADATAKLFGFRAAIAHGMWTMARCAAELPWPSRDAPVALEVQFKLPVFMPAWVILEHWPVAGGSAFALRDSQGAKPHLTGNLVPVDA
jgi:acyl dehydratase